MKNILVTGGSGYVGSALIPQLLASDFNVTIYDIGWFNHQFQNVYEGDIRDTEFFNKVCTDHNIDTIINLACVSNDASFELDEKLSKSINLDAFEPLVIAAKDTGVKRFIHASTSSVYGVSEERDIKEDHPLVPLTLYNRYKAKVEPILLKHLDDKFMGCIIRPATICGYSPRLRLDLTVNIFVNHALTNREIKIFGGQQLRPNLHIRDICNLYEYLVTVPDEMFPNKEIYNCGASNFSIEVIAEVVKYAIQARYPEKDTIKLTFVDSNDQRSYHINSDKIFKDLGFKPQFGIARAIYDLCDAFEWELVPNSMTDTKYYNVKHLQKLGIK